MSALQIVAVSLVFLVSTTGSFYAGSRASHHLSGRDAVGTLGWSAVQAFFYLAAIGSAIATWRMLEGC